MGGRGGSAIKWDRKVGSSSVLCDHTAVTCLAFKYKIRVNRIIHSNPLIVNYIRKKYLNKHKRLIFLFGF